MSDYKMLDYEIFSNMTQLKDYVNYSAIKQLDIQEIIYKHNSKQWVLIYWK